MKTLTAPGSLQFVRQSPPMLSHLKVKACSVNELR